MRTLHASLLITLALCAALDLPARAAASINTAYVVTNQHGIGVVRAFDDGDNTILEFADLDRQQPVVTDAAGTKIRWHRVGEYAVLPGIVPRVTIVANGQVGVAQAAANQGGFDVVEDASPPPPPPKPLQPPATMAPQVTSAGSASPYKPGSAVYEIPWAKHGSTSPSAIPHSPMAHATASVTKTPAGASPSRDTGVTTRIPTAKKAPPQQQWQIAKGSTLRKVLASWSTDAGWIVWYDPAAMPPNVDYTLDVPSTFAGSFSDAVTALFNALPPNIALRAELHAANTPHLLIITINRGNP